MLFAIHPPTVEFQLTVFRLMHRNGERWCELCALAAGERVAGLLHEGVINFQGVDSKQDLPDQAIASANRQTADLIGDNRRIGELFWRNQVELLTGIEQAAQAWRKATFESRQQDSRSRVLDPG